MISKSRSEYCFGTAFLMCQYLILKVLTLLKAINKAAYMDFDVYHKTV